MTDRKRKTPAQRAQEALAVANRTVVRLDKKVDALRTELVEVEREHRAALARRDHLKQHPDLDQEQDTTTPGGTTE